MTEAAIVEQARHPFRWHEQDQDLPTSVLWHRAQSSFQRD